MDNLEVFQPTKDIPVVLSCEHASSTIPEDLNNLGVSEEELHTCGYLCDKGAEGLFDFLVKTLGCRGIKAKMSRLVIDVNRGIHQKELIRDGCNGTILPRNKEITADEREERIVKYYFPYRNTLHDLLTTCYEQFGLCLYFSIHTMENCFEHEQRDMNFAIIYKKGEKLAKALGEILEEKGFLVTYNHPYTLEKDVIRGTQDAQITRFNENAVAVEVNDAITDKRDVRKALADAIKEVAEDYARKK